MVAGTKSIVRTGNPTAVNTETGMTINEGSTAAATPRVPEEVTHLTEVRITTGYDGAAVGAAASLLRLPSIGNGDANDFVGHCAGGQSATGGSTVEPPAVYPVKVPATVGKEFVPVCFMQVTDIGDMTVTAELLFGADPGGEETLCVSRTGQATAVTTASPLETLAGSTTAGSISITKGFGQLRSVHLAAASTSGVTGEFSAEVTLSGNGVNGSTQQYTAGAGGGTLATSGVSAMAAQPHNVGVPTQADQAAPLNGFMHVTDVGAVTFGATLTLVRAGAK